MSSPFVNQRFTFTQPDGTPLEVLGTGNQHQAVFETLDGFTVVEDPVTGFYQYATTDDAGEILIPSGITANVDGGALNQVKGGIRGNRAAVRGAARAMGGLPPDGSRWEMRRAARRESLLMSKAAPDLFRAPPKRETVGTFVGLTLLIDFSDQPATIAREEVEAFCNQTGYTGFGNAGSVRDYFHDVSDGKLEYTNIVAPYYRAKRPRSYYTNEAVPQPRRAWELIREALDHLLASGFDAAALSSDDQDYVYALNVFYAGTRVNNWAKGLWPHSYHLATPYPLKPGKNVFDYQITDMTDELSLGTFCHENGHMICDFPDLYDYGYESNGAGVFCLMCAGGTGAGEKNPAQVGAYLKHAAGWTSNATILQPGQHVSLNAGRNDFAFHRKGQTEYFVIENRQTTGRDAVLPANGLAIWLVDELGSNNNEQGSPSLHYECALIQADGRRQLEGRVNNGDDEDLFKGGFRDSFSAATTPNSKWWDLSESGLTISGISIAAPAMSFDVS